MKQKSIKFLNALAAPILVGAIGGYSAIFFRELIKLNESLFSTLFNTDQNSYIYIILLPLILVFSRIVSKNFLKDTSNTTINSVARNIAIKKGDFDYKKGIIAVILTSIHVGAGIPVGREGPIAKLGSSISSLFSKMIPFTASNVPLYATCGVSSAIAATFNAPIAGIVFGIEIILGKISIDTLTPVTISVITGTLISRFYLGNYPTVAVPHLAFSFHLLYFALLSSIIFALYVLVFKKLAASVGMLEKKLNINPYLFIAIIGLIVGILIAVMPEIKGIGYGEIETIFSQKQNLIHAFILSVTKLIATALILGSNIFGGVFAPSIFIGGFSGYFLGGLANTVDPRAIALIGAASVTAGIANAPLRSALIIMELSQSYQLIVPILIGSVLTNYIATLFYNDSSSYRAMLSKGFDVSDAELIEILNKIKTEELIEPTPEFRKEHTLVELKDIIEKSEAKYFPVLEENKLIGIVSLRDIRMSRKIGDNRIEKIMTRKPRSLKKDSSGSDIINYTSKMDVDLVPVVDSEENFVGMFNVNKFFRKISIEYACKTKHKK